MQDVCREMKNMGQNADLAGFKKILDDVRADTRKICELEYAQEIARLKAQNEDLRKGKPLPNHAIVADAPVVETAFLGDQIGEATSFRTPKGARIVAVKSCSGTWLTGLKFVYSDGTWNAWGFETDDKVDEAVLGEREYIAGISFREGKFIDWIDLVIHGGESTRTVHLGRTPGSGDRTHNLDLKAGTKLVGLNFRQHKGKYFQLEGMSALSQAIR